MPNSSNPANALGGGLLAFFGLFFLATPIAVLLGDGDLGATRPYYIAAAAGGAAMLIGGVQMIVAQRRSLRRETHHENAMRAAAGLPPAAPRPPADAARLAAVAAQPAGAPAAALPSGEPVLAHWTFAPGEWKAYMAAEWKRRVLEGVFLGGLMALIAWTIFRNEPEIPVLKLALGAGVVFFLVPVVRAAAVRHTDPSRPAEAVITPTAVLLNGRHHVLEDGRIRFVGVRRTELGSAPVLEFTVKSPTRRGEVNEQLRVPIPAGRESEANAVVDAFARGWSADTPWLQEQA